MASAKSRVGRVKYLTHTTRLCIGGLYAWKYLPWLPSFWLLRVVKVKTFTLTTRRSECRVATVNTFTVVTRHSRVPDSTRELFHAANPALKCWKSKFKAVDLWIRSSILPLHHHSLPLNLNALGLQRSPVAVSKSDVKAELSQRGWLSEGLAIGCRLQSSHRASWLTQSRMFKPHIWTGCTSERWVVRVKIFTLPTRLLGGWRAIHHRNPHSRPSSDDEGLKCVEYYIYLMINSTLRSGNHVFRKS